MWLHAKPIERARIPQPGTPEWGAFVSEVVSEGFSELRKVNVGLRWSTVQGQGKVACISIPSLDPPGTPLRKAHWHARSSIHFEKDTSLRFDAFEQGLMHHHTAHEKEYLPTLKSAERLETLVPDFAEIWHIRYGTPFFMADRDFVELVLALPLPPSRYPFSGMHEGETIAEWLQGSILPGGDVPPAPEGKFRSFAVLSMPIAHPETPGCVRGYYASAEGVREDVTQVRPGELGTQWMMTTQTDAGGWVPRWVQELAVPWQLPTDVPAFIRWAQKHAKRA